MMRDKGFELIDAKVRAEVTSAPRRGYQRPLAGVLSALLKDNSARSNAAEASHKPIAPPTVILALTPFRFAIPEAAMVLRMSRRQLYKRLQEGSIKSHKDGSRTYITRTELERYIESCG